MWDSPVGTLGGDEVHRLEGEIALGFILRSTMVGVHSSPRRFRVGPQPSAPYTVSQGGIHPKQTQGLLILAASSTPHNFVA